MQTKLYIEILKVGRITTSHAKKLVTCDIGFISLSYSLSSGGTVVKDKFNWTHVRILRQLSTDLIEPPGTVVTPYPVYPLPLWYRSSLWRWLSFKPDIRYSFWTRITWVVSVGVVWGSGGRIFSGIILSACNFGSYCRGYSSWVRLSIFFSRK